MSKLRCLRSNQDRTKRTWHTHERALEPCADGPAWHGWMLQSRPSLQCLGIHHAGDLLRDSSFTEERMDVLGAMQTVDSPNPAPLEQLGGDRLRSSPPAFQMERAPGRQMPTRVRLPAYVQPLSPRGLDGILYPALCQVAAQVYIPPTKTR